MNIETLNENIEISVVSPTYKCSECIEELYRRLVLSLEKITDTFEILFVNDGSPDNDWEIIKDIAKRDKRVKGINLSRNFGQHYAITAGLDYAIGNWIVVMDCDLQDQPEEIKKLYNKAQEGFDVVVGKRKERKDKFFKKLTSKFFYIVYNYFVETKINNRIGNFGIYSNKVIQSINKMREQNRSFGLFAIWVGFSRIEIDVIHAKRNLGQSSYTLKKMIALALDSIITYSDKLLKLSIKTGFILSFVSLVYSLWTIIKYLIWGIPVRGWTSMFVSIYFLSGLILGSIGILGLYIGKIFDETKNRPLYIIESTTFNITK